MSNIINELKAEHAHLDHLFVKIEHLDVSSKEASEQLQAVKLAVLNHLKKENQTIYPKLREAAFNNLRLQRKLDLFARDTVRLSTIFIQFIDKYSEGGSNLDFKRDFSRLSKILSAFAKREEEVIFSEYLDMKLDEVA